MNKITITDDAAHAIAQLHDAILPAAELQAQNSGRTVLSCMSTMVRKMLANHMRPAPLRSGPDGRSRDWKIKIYFWDITYGFESGVLLAENGGSGEVIKGLQAVVPYVQIYSREVHPDEEIERFDTARLRQHFGGLYSAISKGKGEASTRLHYELDGKSLMCQVDIERI